MRRLGTKRGEKRQEREALRQRVDGLGNWYHRIDLGDGVITPGDRNQSLVFAMYEDLLPPLSGLRVLDVGSNAGGLSIEFARRGAHVTAIEFGATYVAQAEFVRDHFGLADRIEIHRTDIYSLAGWTEAEFDIVAYLGLSYHLRHPQLALDLLSSLCSGQLLVSSQTIPGDELVMRNRASAIVQRPIEMLHGWEPTEALFMSMVAHAGFKHVRHVSTAPHPGESKGNLCGNRSYFFADAAEQPASLPFVDHGFIGKPEVAHRRLTAD